MKIEWTNDALTEVIVTRGIFRKRRAHIRLVNIEYQSLDESWRYQPSGDPVRDDHLKYHLRQSRRKEWDRRKENRNWSSIGKPPKAQVIRR